MLWIVGCRAVADRLSVLYWLRCHTALSEIGQFRRDRTNGATIKQQAALQIGNASLDANQAGIGNSAGARSCGANCVW
jgi:hypothetical protein